MTTYRPFWLLNASECARIEELSARAADAWREGWTTDTTAQPPECRPAAERDHSLESGWLSFTAPTGTCYVADGERVTDVVRATVAGGAADSRHGPAGDDPHTIADELAATAVQDLVERLIGKTTARSSRSPPGDLWRRGSGAAAIAMPLRRGQIVFMLDTTLVSSLIGRQRTSSARPPALVAAQQCLGAQPVDIGVWLGSADIELATLQSLAVDNVLMLDSRIDHPLHLTVAGRNVAPRALLGRVGSNKAIRLTTYSAEIG